MASASLLLACASVLAALATASTRPVAVVTGGTRGIGLGIARGLGEQGWKVYITGRSATELTVSDPEVGGTLARATALVSEVGGEAIGIKVDHTDDEAVTELFAQVAAENDGCLDLLVNNAFRGIVGLRADPFAPFWEQGEELWDACANVGLRSHYVASCRAVPLLRRSKKTPLIVNVSSFGGLSYTFNVAYGVCKAAVDRLSADTARELKDVGVATLSLWPGVVATERMRLVLEDGDFAANTGMQVTGDYLETPLLVGRVVARLAAESREERLRKSGEVEVVAEYAAAKNILDEHGKRPPSIRSLKFILPVVVGPKVDNSAIRRWFRSAPDLLLPFWVMAGGSPE